MLERIGRRLLRNSQQRLPAFEQLDDAVGEVHFELDPRRHQVRQKPLERELQTARLQLLDPIRPLGARTSRLNAARWAPVFLSESTQKPSAPKVTPLCTIGISQAASAAGAA